jgi:transposase
VRIATLRLASTRLQRVVPPQKTGPQAILGDLLFIEAVMYWAKTGLPWRDLARAPRAWKALSGDTGRDSNKFMQAVRELGKKPVIHSQPERKKKHRLDRRLYRQRHPVELSFHQPNRFRAIVTRYEKTARNYLALVQLGRAWLWLS